MSYQARQLSLRIGTATLLDDVSIELEPGEVVAVAGPNGAGKSSLLALLAGDRAPSSGNVTLAGRSLGDWPRGELARRRAVMGADRAVAFAFTAREVALLGRMPLHGGDPTPADHEIVAELLAAVDCAQLGDRVYATLSTGERQRVQLARAVAQVADAGDGVDAQQGGTGERFLLLDEPTSSLDPAHQHTAMALIRRMADGGLGVLAVLHDLNLAAAYADRVVLMAHGRVVESGAPDAVLRPEVLEAVFDIPMLVMPHPQLSHPLVIAEPHLGER